MTRAFTSTLLAVMALGLAACETGGSNVAGTADYDSLKRANADCAAKGGKLVLKPEGNAEYIDAYECKGT
ncbi:MAG: hypothetical protein ACXWKO_16910 [Phenylobacterium sp.]